MFVVVIEYRLERKSGVPTYLQIVGQTKRALRLGLLRPGDRLPTAKEVVAATAVNPNTVLKAYRELEREGLVEPMPGLGTFVRASIGLIDVEVHEPLRAELLDWLDRARTAGLGIDDVEALFAAATEQRFAREGA